MPHLSQEHPLPANSTPTPIANCPWPIQGLSLPEKHVYSIGAKSAGNVLLSHPRKKQRKQRGKCKTKTKTNPTDAARSKELK